MDSAFIMSTNRCKEDKRICQRTPERSKKQCHRDEKSGSRIFLSPQRSAARRRSLLETKQMDSHPPTREAIVSPGNKARKSSLPSARSRARAGKAERVAALEPAFS